MAIINCPKCSKKTSEISPRCPHCGFVRTHETDERKLELARRELRDHIYRLKMTSYGVITMLMAAFGWYWWDTNGFLERSSGAPVLLMALTAIAYLFARVLLFRAAKKMKKIRKAQLS